MITNIIFDFFGTLVGYSEEWDITRENTSYEYFSTLGFSMEKQEFIQKYGECFMDLTKKATENRNEFHMYDLGKYFFQKYFQYQIDDKSNKLFIDKSVNDWNVNVVYFNNINDFIEKLSKKYRLSILSNTNYPDLVHRNLINMDIHKYFYKVYTSVEIGIKKPNKQIFEYVLNDLEVQSSNTLFVGDNYNDDYLGARRVGMECYLIDKHNRYDNSINTKINNVFELTSNISC